MCFLDCRGVQEVFSARKDQPCVELRVIPHPGS